jgi:hypothetical protein
MLYTHMSNVFMSPSRHILWSLPNHTHDTFTYSHFCWWYFPYAPQVFNMLIIYWIKDIQIHRGSTNIQCSHLEYFTVSLLITVIQLHLYHFLEQLMLISFYTMSLFMYLWHHYKQSMMLNLIIMAPMCHLWAITIHFSSYCSFMAVFCPLLDYLLTSSSDVRSLLYTCLCSMFNSYTWHVLMT